MTRPSYAPHIHLNGSGAHNLLDQYSAAVHALRKAQRAISASYPHMRDYYPLPDGEAIWRTADAAHRARLRKLEEIIEEFEALAQTVIDQDLQQRSRHAQEGRT